MLLQIQHPSTGQEPVLKDSHKSLEKFVRNAATLTLEAEQHMRRVFCIFEALITRDPDTFGSNYLTVAKNFSAVSLLYAKIPVTFTDVLTFLDGGDSYRLPYFCVCRYKKLRGASRRC
jgi:hypothetical protein